MNQIILAGEELMKFRFSEMGMIGRKKVEEGRPHSSWPSLSFCYLELLL